MERIPYIDGHTPLVCLTCPARVFVEGEYRCDNKKLNDKKIIMDVARYRPFQCPNNVIAKGNNMPPEILLRKILGK